jgi:hypothetical protein
MGSVSRVFHKALQGVATVASMVVLEAMLARCLKDEGKSIQHEGECMLGNLSLLKPSLPPDARRWCLAADWDDGH